MKKAVCYYRKSIEREADKSIQGQKEVVHQYATDNGIQIVAEFAEVASSATIDRKELDNLFAFIKENKVDYILLHRFDRITREVIHMGYIMTLLEKTGKTRLHSATESNDYENNPTKIMMIIMQTYGATIERIAAVERMQDARKRKAEKGGWLGGTPPIGYKPMIGTGQLAIEESEVCIVKDVFEWREEGETMQEIADRLNVKGYKTRKKKSFYPSTVQRIIKHKNWYEGKGQAPSIL